MNTFEQIEKLYNSITPLRGPRASYDIRPLHKRSKWYERIAKIDDNTYVLSDGWWAGAYINSTPEQVEIAKHNMQQVGPIVWERRKDGDYIRIYSCRENTASWSRYKFISYWLPRYLRHNYNSNGVHWIETGGKKYLLPKWSSKEKSENNPQILHTDENYLEFKVEQGPIGEVYTCVSKEYKRQVPIVNREITKKYNPMIKEYWEWIRVTMPVFGNTLNEQRQWAIDTMGFSVAWWGWQREIKPEVLREILEYSEEYPEQRLALALLSVRAIDAVDWQTDSTFEDKGKSTYNKFRNLMHKLGDMKSVKEVGINE